MKASGPLRGTADAAAELVICGLFCALSLFGSSQIGSAAPILPGDIIAISSTDQGVNDGAGSILRIDPVTGAQSVLSAGSYIDVGLTQDRRIFAITGTALVEVDPVTSDVRLVRDLTDLGSPTGLAVGPAGALFVAYEDTATRLTGIESIDAGSGSGSTFSSLGSFGRVTDLEFIAGGNLAALAEPPGGDAGDLFVQIVDALTGVPDISDLVILRGIALGVSPDGDRIAAVAFGIQGTQAGELLVATGDVSPLNVPLFAGVATTCTSPEPGCGDDLTRSDVAYEESGRLLLSVNSRPGAAPWTSRLFRLEADGTSQVVTEGSFSELQVAVPEPPSAALLGAGVLGLAFWRRAAQNA